MKHTGVVLCGGLSTRMGRAKAWLPWKGKPLVRHVVDVLATAVDEVVVVTSEHLALPPLPATVVTDREPELGPLAGIREGLEAAHGSLAFVTATDAPGLTKEFVVAMLCYGKAAAPEHRGRIQPLSAVYPVSAHGLAGDLLAEGRRRPLDLLEALSYRLVPEGDLPWAVEGDGSGAPLRGFNTPIEYLEAVRLAEPGAAATVELFGRSRLAVGRSSIEAPIGTMAELLEAVAPGMDWLDEKGVRRDYLVSLNARDFVRDPGIPVGPGERIIVLDAPAGG